MLKLKRFTIILQFRDTKKFAKSKRIQGICKFPCIEFVKYTKYSFVKIIKYIL